MQSNRFVWIVVIWVMLFTGPVTFARQQAVLADKGLVDVEQETASFLQNPALFDVLGPSTHSATSGTVPMGRVRATFMVTNTNDSGAGSLRQAILDANASANGSEPDEIHFGIDAQTDPGCDSNTGVCTIMPTQALPVISEAVILDGETQEGADCSADISSRTLKVVLNGSAATAEADGLILAGSGSTVRGLVIRDFSERGILISGGSNGDHIIACNFIGTDVTGTIAHANLKGGVRIQFGAANNIVGGTTADAGNLISGNGADWWSGISLYASATGNRIEGNYIGTDATGTMPLGNHFDGISIIAATNNIVGGTTEGARNVISGNSRGIRMVNTVGNRIEGNYIGTDATGTVGIGNSRGIDMEDKSSDNIIGGTTAAARNIIASNTFSGIELSGDNSTGNRIEGNYIGTDASGLIGLGNANGVRINGGAINNVIGGTTATARNIISSSASYDVSIFGAGTGANRIEGNYIGTDVTGAAVFEDGSGILLATGDQNIIGGTEPGARNIVARRIHLANADNQVIQGNYVGIDVTGTVAFDASTGIYIQAGSSGNLVGGTTPAARNVISGGSFRGVLLQGEGTDNNIIQGNYIGTDATGTVPIGNGKGLFIYQGAANNEIGGTTPNAGNVIAYSDTDGIALSTDAGIGNAILGNSLFENGQEGIDHEEDGPTFNDPGDADMGPNQLQNFPDLTDIAYNESDELFITYFIDTDPANATYPLTVEFFESDSAVQEGQVFLGRTTYTIADYNGCGTPPCAKTINLGNMTAERIVATATDDAGNTSEFSNPVLLADGPFLVTNTNDSGAGSLRQAMHDANAFPNGSEPDEIRFAIDAQTDPGCDGGTGVCTIAVLDELPAITEAVVLDGETQEGADCGSDIPSRTLKIVLSGEMASSFISGITIASSGSTIRGLVIQQFDARWGILITGASATNNVIACNFIGPDATGTSAPTSNQDGIWIEEGASNNTIGGTTADAGNLISGGNRFGIFISEANNNQVLSNFIGTDRTGTVALGNSADGIIVSSGGSNNVIGGTSAAERNIISGNGTEGVQIQSENTTNNRVEGNFIGTDLTGTVALGNGNIGVFIGNAAGNIIGGTTPGASNVIADNGSSGIHIEGDDGAGNRIEGNFIGTAVNGTTDLGNSRAGIRFFGNAHDNTIGGEASGAGNIIAFNNIRGIELASVVGANNAFLGNRIFENNGLGIDLAENGVTLNDPGDPDTGPNNLQNFPDLADAVINGSGDLFVTYRVDTDPGNATYPLLVEFFKADADDQEGQVFLGRSSYTTADHNGCGTPPCEATVNLGEAAVLGISEDDRLIATATDDDGNTSEFSDPLSMVTGPFFVTNTNDSGIGSLRQAIRDANHSPNGDEPDDILFDIDVQTDPGCDSGTGVCTIAVLDELPAITEAVVLDGETQEGADCGSDIPSRTLKIVLSGEMASSFISGITITSSGSTIRGLVIQQFDARWGILITGASATNNVIVCNFIGPDATGTSAPTSNQDGIWIEENASDNIIGGSTADAGNLISGGNRTGIRILSGNANRIQGNFIGLDRTGTVALGNSSDGIVVSSTSVENIIGGASAAERNVISGNHGEGITLSASSNRVEGNFIGTDLTGTVALGNGSVGVFIAGTVNNVVGGTAPGTSNIIAANGSSGIFIQGSGATENRIEGNFIGTDLTATLDLGNTRDGVHFFSGPHHNTIGGTALGAGNTIAFNAMQAISPESNAGIGNAFLSNSLFENTLLGIDLGGNGVTPNDPSDLDTGPNNLQNFPDLTDAVIDGDGDLLVTYRVDTDPSNATYPLTVEVFKADANDQEGEVFLGRDFYSTTNHSGCGTPPCEATVNLGNAATLGVSEGDRLVATATDDEGNTSEFSANTIVVASATRYVATTGTDTGNDCTDAKNPCATLPHAVNQANPGDVIELAAGTYDGLGLLIEKALTLQGEGVVVE